MINFDFNFLNKALEVLALPEEEKKDLLTKYNNLLVVKMMELSGLTEEEKKTFQDKNPMELFAKLGEVAKNNPEFLRAVEDYTHNLNLEFIETFSKTATPEQKIELIAYFDEYEKQLNNLSQQ